jgi:hypothetical protein
MRRAVAVAGEVGECEAANGGVGDVKRRAAAARWAADVKPRTKVSESG